MTETADGAHGNSLWAKSLKDRSLRRRIENGRRKARVDQEHMELWAGADFESMGLTPNEPYGTLVVEEER